RIFALGVKRAPTMWVFSRNNSIIRQQDYLVSAARLAEPNFRYTHPTAKPPTTPAATSPLPANAARGVHVRQRLPVISRPTRSFRMLGPSVSIIIFVGLRQS